MRGPDQGPRAASRPIDGVPATRWSALPGDLPLELGGVLTDVRVAYRTLGRLDPGGDNAVVVCHALTGSADVDLWWPGLLGPGRALDPARDFILCTNILGSCYGTTGPTSVARETGRPYGPCFPSITIRDMVRVQADLARHLGVRRVKLVIGGSLGGMQALEWACVFPGFVDAVVPIATAGRHSAWCIALSEAQREAIRADPKWRDGRYPPEDPPSAGLAIARMIAMCTYRSRASFTERFARSCAAASTRGYAVEQYLHRQGEKLVRRFDANAYMVLSRAMDTHDVGRGRGGYEEALGRLAHPALVVSIPTDVLYPPEEQEELARLLPNASLVRLQSLHGHDGFLIDTEELNALILEFRARLREPHARPRLELVR